MIVVLFLNHCLRLFATFNMAFALVVFLLKPVPAAGASTQIWELSEHKDFLLGEFEGVSLLQSGALTPAPRLVPLFNSDQPVIWTVAVATDGTAYIGTGHQGKVYRLGTDGEVSLFWTAPEIEVFALVVGPAGEIYAGTSPKGKLYRITSQGVGEEIFDPKEAYIWSLVIAPIANTDKGKEPLIYMGTGGEGKIYAVETSGQGQILVETKQRHVISLALDTEGQLLAGTDPNGIVYRIGADGDIFALYDADQPEVRSLQVMPNGDIYAAAMGGGATRVVQAVSSFATVPASPMTKTQVGSKLASQVSPQIFSSAQPAMSVAQPVTAYPGMERSALLRIQVDLSVEKLWSSSEENILAVGIQGGKTSESENPDDPASKPRVLFSTDRKGRIYELADWRYGTQRQVSLVTESGHQQITQLITDQRGLLVASAHSASLSRFQSWAEASGTYESVIHDAKTFARWGQLMWEGYAADSERLEILTRSGNSAVPDASWSEWSKAIEGGISPKDTEAFVGSVMSPPARYIQWKVNLNTKDQIAPMLRKVRLAYLPRNSSPHVTELRIEASEEKRASSVGSTTVATTSQTAAAHSITVSALGSSVPTAVGVTTRAAIGGGVGKDMKISWKTHDPDGDKLIALVAFRETGGSLWKVIEKDIKNNYVVLDSESLADGTYRFQVVVSDRASNPPEVAHEAKEISEPVLIDHTPPQVNIVEVNGRETLVFEVIDKDSVLTTAEYAINAGKWIPIYPKDGILDSRREGFLILLEGLPEGEHLLTLRVRDRSGNPGLGKVSIP